MRWAELSRKNTLRICSSPYFNAMGETTLLWTSSKCEASCRYQKIGWSRNAPNPCSAQFVPSWDQYSRRLFMPYYCDQECVPAVQRLSMSSGHGLASGYGIADRSFTRLYKAADTITGDLVDVPTLIWRCEDFCGDISRNGDNSAILSREDPVANTQLLSERWMTMHLFIQPTLIIKQSSRSKLTFLPDLDSIDILIRQARCADDRQWITSHQRCVRLTLHRCAQRESLQNFPGEPNLLKSGTFQSSDWRARAIW